jgi:hypothetical protein
MAVAEHAPSSVVTKRAAKWKDCVTRCIAVREAEESYLGEVDAKTGDFTIQLADIAIEAIRIGKPGVRTGGEGPARTRVPGATYTLYRLFAGEEDRHNLIERAVKEGWTTRQAEAFLNERKPKPESEEATAETDDAAVKTVKALFGEPIDIPTAELIEADHERTVSDLRDEFEDAREVDDRELRAKKVDVKRPRESPASTRPG